MLSAAAGLHVRSVASAAWISARTLAAGDVAGSKRTIRSACALSGLGNCGRSALVGLFCWALLLGSFGWLRMLWVCQGVGCRV